MSSLPRSVATIPRLIIHSRLRFHCFYLASDMLGGTFLCCPLLCGRRRQSYQIRRFHSAKWDTIDNFPPNMPDLVLLRLFCRCPNCPAYMLPSSSAADPIISHQLNFLPLPLPLPPPPTEYAPELGRYKDSGLPCRC